MSYGPEETGLIPQEYDPAKEWKKKWMLAKEKMLGKMAKKKQEWKERAASDEAETQYVLKVVEAARERRRKKALEKVSPDEWLEQTARSVLKKTISDIEVRRWEQASAPYREFVRTASELLKAKGYRGRELGVLWQQIVVPKLEQAKRRPELIPRLMQELRSEIERLPEARVKRIRPEQIEIVIRG